MQRRQSNLRLLPLIIVGLVAGIVFVLLDNPSAPTVDTSPSPDNTESAIEPTADSQVVEATNAVPTVNAPFAPDIPVDTALFIPSAGILSPIQRVYIDGTIGSWNVSRLGNNIGHLEGTSWLPDDGNVVLSGHVELAGGDRGIFANLHELNIGERVVIQHEGMDYHYDIVSVGITEPTDLTPLYPTNDGINRLTLITCGDYDFLSNSYLERVIVVAEQVQVSS